MRASEYGQSWTPRRLQRPAAIVPKIRAAGGDRRRLSPRHAKTAFCLPRATVRHAGFTSGTRRSIVTRVIRNSADRRFVTVDENTRARIAAAYRDHGLSLRLLEERFRLGAGTLKRVLAEAGIVVRGRSRPCDFYRAMP